MATGVEGCRWDKMPRKVLSTLMALARYIYVFLSFSWVLSRHKAQTRRNVEGWAFAECKKLGLLPLPFPSMYVYNYTCAVYIYNVSQVSVLVTGMGELRCLPPRSPCSSSSQLTGDGRTCFFPISSSEATLKLSFCLCTNWLLSNIPKTIGSAPEGKIRVQVNVISPPPSLFFFFCLQYSFSSLEIIFLPMFSASMWQTFPFPVEQEPMWLPRACIGFVYPINSFLGKVNSPEICSASPWSTRVSPLGFSTSCKNLSEAKHRLLFFLVNTILRTLLILS